MADLTMRLASPLNPGEIGTIRYRLLINSETLMEPTVGLTADPDCRLYPPRLLFRPHNRPTELWPDQARGGSCVRPFDGT